MVTPYSNRELDHNFSDIKETLSRIETQTTKTNGRVTRLEIVILVMGTAIAVLLTTNSSELLGIFKLII